MHLFFFFAGVALRKTRELIHTETKYWMVEHGGNVTIAPIVCFFFFFFIKVSQMVAKVEEATIETKTWILPVFIFLLCFCTLNFTSAKHS